jgi:hypothetical protein
MLNFWDQINLLIFIVISLSMAPLLTNSANPEKMEELYSECHRLCESHKFNEIINKLSEKIPIKKGGKSNAVWNAQGQVNYDNLLPAIKQTLVEAKKRMDITQVIKSLGSC